MSSNPFPLVAIAGESEMANGTLNLKTRENGEQRNLRRKNEMNF